ncbi:MAG: hypothetical protein UR12_C0010G0042 [candidate division TM6 bacterium GW2011_GWF2_30_66]|jgi:murein DD-endopeptidase MepM/ murein hydrolase activator NlpD|nr:MAG: hypothetical protein UR12_C0010G0042 [candidate division TM6 bacterium GW2011_GWF2_30_66]
MNLNSEKYSFNIIFFGKIIFAILLISMLVTSYFLYLEYDFFKKQSNSMLELQEDYRTYIGAVNKILVDYNRVKEELEKKSCDIPDRQDQKKKDKSLDDNFDKNRFNDIYFYENFPKNSKLVSSSDESSESFCVVNRDLKHLKSGSLGFIKNYYKSKPGGYSNNIGMHDFTDYTDYSLARIVEANKMLQRAKDARIRSASRAKMKKVKIPRKTKKISSYPKENYSEKVKGYDGDYNEIHLSWPIDKTRFYFSSLYGPRRKRSGAWGFHYGVDMAALKGTSVYAAHGGIVVEARFRPGYGNNIVIAHSRKYRTRYAHLSKMLVSVGQKVSRSEIVGAVGNTGYVRSSHGDGSHLHFEVIELGKKINPLPFIS